MDDGRKCPPGRSLDTPSVELKVLLYADILLLLMSDLCNSVPAALSVLEAFGNISGYKRNLVKSEMFAANKMAREFPT